MHISWSFLDKRKAAIEAICAYKQMDFIIKHTDDDIRRVEAKMEGVGSPKIDGMPHCQNPAAGEERMISCIEEIDMLKERYRQAVEYMNWFKPVWNQLSDDDQFVLDAFFMNDEEEYDAADVIAEHFGIERASAYNRRKRAIERVTTLLYGRF